MKNKFVIPAFVLVVVIIVVTAIAMVYNGQQNDRPPCNENDWNCICTRIESEAACKVYPDCT
jgi:hypothetical protein